MKSSKTHFNTLDGLRGILAIAVVIHHYSMHFELKWMNNAWVAVDIFFIISGFVITHSYERRITEGESFYNFMYRRLNRLYPMFLFAVILSVIGFYLFTTTPNTILIEKALLSSFALPYYGSDTTSITATNISSAVYPLNDPAWSLFFEFFVSAIFFYAIFFLKTMKIKITFFILTSILYFIAVYNYGPHPGWSKHNFLGGFPRVIFYFFIGYFLYHIYRKFNNGHSLVFATLLVMYIISFNIQYWNLVYILLALSPILVLSATKSKFFENTTFSKPIFLIGAISYPLYITHFVLILYLDNLFDFNEYTPETKLIFYTFIAILMATIFTQSEIYIRKALRN